MCRCSVSDTLTFIFSNKAENWLTEMSMYQWYSGFSCKIKNQKVTPKKSRKKLVVEIKLFKTFIDHENFCFETSFHKAKTIEKLSSRAFLKSSSLKSSFQNKIFCEDKIS